MGTFIAGKNQGSTGTLISGSEDSRVGEVKSVSVRVTNPDTGKITSIESSLARRWRMSGAVTDSGDVVFQGTLKTSMAPYSTKRLAEMVSTDIWYGYGSYIGVSVSFVVANTVCYSLSESEYSRLVV